MQKEEHEEAPSVYYEIEGMIEMFQIVMNDVMAGKEVPHPEAVALTLELSAQNEVLDNWADREHYPAMAKWLNDAAQFRTELIAELRSVHCQQAQT